MVIDGFPPEQRFEPTIELLESLGYQRIETTDVGEAEYNIKTAGGQASEAALRAFFVQYLCTTPVDMRKSFRGLCSLAENLLQTDPAAPGQWFAFINRRADRLKLLGWYRRGFWIWYMHLEAGTFQSPVCDADSTHIEIDITQLSLIINGVDLNTAKRRFALPRPRARRRPNASAGRSVARPCNALEPAAGNPSRIYRRSRARSTRRFCNAHIHADITACGFSHHEFGA